MDTIRMVYSAYRDYFAGSGLGIVVCAGLIWLLRYRKGKRTGLLALTGLILTGIVVFPLSAWLIARVIGDDVYWRVFWIVPCIALAAVFLTEWIHEMPSRVKRMLAAAGCAALIALNGTLVFSGDFFQKRENNYKLPTEVIRVAQAIEEDAAVRGIRLMKIVAPVEIAFLIRLYDPTLRLSYGRGFVKNGGLHDLYIQINSLTPDYELLATSAKADKRRYVVMHSEADNRAAMENFNYEAVFDDCGYVVYLDRKYGKN